MTALELRKLREEEVRAVLEGWSQVKRLIAYHWLNVNGCRLDQIDYNLEKALREEAKESSK